MCSERRKLRAVPRFKVISRHGANSIPSPQGSLWRPEACEEFGIAAVSVEEPGVHLVLSRQLHGDAGGNGLITIEPDGLANSGADGHGNDLVHQVCARDRRHCKVTWSHTVDFPTKVAWEMQPIARGVSGSPRCPEICGAVP